jgi:hypothetical protein
MKELLYTPARLEWLKINAVTLTPKELHENFNKTFNTNATFRGIKVVCLRRNISILNKQWIKPLGSETITSNNNHHDEIRIKVCKNKNCKIAWRLKQNILWEQFHNQKLPDKWLVVFLNNNKTDFSKENLYTISRYVHTIMAGQNWYNKAPEITYTCILLCKLQQALKNNNLIEKTAQFSNIFAKILCEHKLDDIKNME